MAVAGALGLMTFGRALATDRAGAAQAALAWGVVALALEVAVLRWGSVSLDELRGVQAVLGPTVTVSPDEAAAGAALAAGAGVVALGLWMASARPSGWRGHALVLGEGAVFALALVTAFWGEALVAPVSGAETDLLALARWAVGVAGTSVVSAGLFFVLVRVSRAWRWASGAVALAAGLAGVVVVPGVVSP